MSLTQTINKIAPHVFHPSIGENRGTGSTAFSSYLVQGAGEDNQEGGQDQPQSQNKVRQLTTVNLSNNLCRKFSKSLTDLISKVFFH